MGHRNNSENDKRHGLVLVWYLHLIGSSLCLSGSPALLQNQRRSMGRQNNSTTEDSLIRQEIHVQHHF